MKWFLRSKTFWGGFLILLPAFAKLVDVDMSATTVEKLQMNVAELSQTIGLVLGLFGIRMADGKLTISNPKKNSST